MMLSSTTLVLWNYRHRNQNLIDETPDMKLDLPFSLPLALKYGVVFLGLHIVGGLTQRMFGDVGFYLVSIVGGLMSSASAVAAAAALASQGHLSPTVAGNGAVLASFTSIAFSLSFVVHSGNSQLIRRLAVAMACVVLTGTLGLIAWNAIHPLAIQWFPQIEGKLTM